MKKIKGIKSMRKLDRLLPKDGSSIVIVWRANGNLYCNAIRRNKDTGIREAYHDDGWEWRNAEGIGWPVDECESLLLI